MDNEINVYDLLEVMFGSTKHHLRPYDFEMDGREPIRAIKWHTTCPSCAQLVEIDKESENRLIRYNDVILTYCTHCDMGKDAYGSVAPSHNEPPKPQIDNNELKAKKVKQEKEVKPKKGSNKSHLEFDLIKGIESIPTINKELTFKLNNISLPEIKEEVKTDEPDEQSDKSVEDLLDDLANE